MIKGKHIATVEIWEDNADGDDSAITFAIMRLGDEEPQELDLPPAMVEQLPQTIAMIKMQAQMLNKAGNA